MTDNLIDEGLSESPVLDQNKDYYSELVGEGKKFKDNQALAYGKAQSDSYIKLLERQLDQIKSDYNDIRVEAATRTRIEDLVNKLNQPSSNQPAVTTDNTKPEINMNEIESLVSRKIQETETQKIQQNNLNMVKAELQKRFGDRLEDHLKEVGLTGESAAQLAKVNPQLVLKALGAERQIEPSFNPPPRSTSVSSFNKAQPERTWSYYQEIFKKDPSAKYDQKINVQMQKDYIRLGEAFEDGNFKQYGH